MTLSKREKALLIILAVVIVIAAFLYFLILPLVDEIKENSRTLENDKITLQYLQQANEPEKLTDQQKDIRNEIMRIDKILPTQVKIPEVLLEILYIGDAIGIEQKSITMQNTIIEGETNTENQEDSDENSEEKVLEDNMKQNTQEKLLIVPINHNFRGTYSEIKSYIDEIQNCERKIDIIEYQISSNDEEGGQISANFLLHSYALVKDAQDYSEFVDYDFIKGKYGRSNPFKQGSFTVIEDELYEIEEDLKEVDEEDIEKNLEED